MSRLHYLLVVGITGLLTGCPAPPPPPPSGSTVYVDANKESGGNGSSWASAYNNLQNAINAASANAEIWIAKGTYTPSSPLNPKSGQKIYGGFNGTETLVSQRNIPANPTVVDGRNSLKHVFYVSYSANNVRIDGVEIKDGSASGGSGWDAHGGGVFVDQRPITIENCRFRSCYARDIGGGLFVNRGSATVINTEFIDNTSDMGGGLGAYDSDVTVTDCYFEDNDAAGATASGGGIWVLGENSTVTDSTFLSNTAGYGGGIHAQGVSSLSVSGSTFSGNDASVSGGGLACASSDGAVVTGCVFTQNSTDGGGGGLYSHVTRTTIQQCWFIQNTAHDGGGLMLDYKVSPQDDVVERCVFTLNQATETGGGIGSYARSVKVSNSILAYNAASNGGGGAMRLHAGVPGDPTENNNYNVELQNCVVYGNTTGGYGGGLLNSYVDTLNLYNTIFWANDADNDLWDPGYGWVPAKDVYNAGSSGMNVRYCDMESLDWAHGSTWENHTGSFDANPRFEDPNGSDNQAGTVDDDFTLKSDSPCLDHADGNNMPALDIFFNGRTDLAGVPNQGTGSPNYGDVGAYEQSSGGEAAEASLGRTPKSALVQPATREVPEKAVKLTDVGTSRATANDFDGDGVADVAVYAQLTGDWLIQSSRGDGVKRQAWGGGSASPVAGDYDGDGAADVAVAQLAPDRWCIIESARGEPRTTAWNHTGLVNVPADYDGDGQTDVAGYDPADGTWYIQASTGKEPLAATWGWPGAVAVPGDYDGDGRTDLAVYDTKTGTWYIRQSAGTGVTETQWGWAHAVPVPGDYDGDGRTDLAVYDADTGNWFMLESRTGAGRMQQWGGALGVAVPADYDGDGVQDLTIYHAASGHWYIQESASGSFRLVTLGGADAVPVAVQYQINRRLGLVR